MRLKVAGFPDRPLTSSTEKGRVLSWMYDNYVEARTHWVQEGIQDGCSQRIRQIVLLSGDHEATTPAWHWPYDARVCSSQFPGTILMRCSFDKEL